jgi:hypothetical protein
MAYVERRFLTQVIICMSVFSGSSLAVLGFCLAATSAHAAEEAVATAPGEIQEVVVFGRGEAKIGVAHAASEGTISGAAYLTTLHAYGRPWVTGAAGLCGTGGWRAAERWPTSAG